MKLRNYFLLSIVVGAAVACSSNEDIPEEHVFTPNATLSLATGVYGDGRCYFFFVESDDAPVALEYCLYHNLLCLNVTVFFSLIAETKIL